MLHSSLKARDFSSLNVAVWRTGKPKCTPNWSCMFEGVSTVGEPSLFRGLRQVGYMTTLQSGVLTEGYGPVRPSYFRGC